MSSPDRIVMQYRRDGILVTGNVAVYLSVTQLAFERFTQLTFERALLRLMGHMAAYPDVNAIYFERSDRADSTFKVDGQTVQLMRSDPVAALRTFQVPDLVIDLRPKSRPVQGLSAGYETAIEAFGDEVYCGCRKHDDVLEVECPYCGKWTNLPECLGCHRALSGRVCHNEWFSVKVEDLLRVDANKYFLPRVWNVFGYWISRDELAALYEQWLKEKNDG